MKRVLHVVKEYRGNYPLLNEYVKSLPQDRYYSCVCYLGGCPDGRNDLEHFASAVRYLEFSKREMKYCVPGVLRRLIRVMRSEKIDVVHCHRHRATVLGTVAATFCGIPNVISHVHGLSRTRSKKRYLTNWVIFKRVKRIIAVSDSVRQDILNTNRKLDSAKVVTVRNGLNITTIDNVDISKREARLKLGVPQDVMIFGTVGRLTETKGQSYLIDAFSEVEKKISDAVLVIIGDGPLAVRLRNKAEALNLSSKIFFTGYRSDVRELLRGLDIFVLPSVAEGLSIALLEAMASKLPVIASQVGGIPEVLDDHCGMLVPARDPHALAEAMEEMARLDDQQKALFARKARKQVEESFTTRVMHQKLREVYESIP